MDYILGLQGYHNLLILLGIPIWLLILIMLFMEFILFNRLSLQTRPLQLFPIFSVKTIHMVISKEDLKLIVLSLILAFHIL